MSCAKALGLVFSTANKESFFKDLWWFEWEMFPITSCISTLGPQFVALFGEVMEPLGGGAVVGEEFYSRQALRVYSLAHFLFPVWRWKMWSTARGRGWSKYFLSPATCVYFSAFPAVMDSDPLEPAHKINPSVIKLFLCMVFSHSGRKITNSRSKIQTNTEQDEYMLVFVSLVSVPVSCNTLEGGFNSSRCLLPVERWKFKQYGFCRVALKIK